MSVYENVLEAIGNTPIVKLNKITRGLPCNVYVKCEFLNPGGSIKDRIGWYLIDDAVARGQLKPGGTVVEGTSGNTGVALAIASAVKGYSCIFVLPDKMSDEKIKNLRAFGAKVVVTPTAVEPEDPRSYYSVSKRLSQETPNSAYMNQYNNLANRECHAKYTGPEILKQFPEVDVIVAGIGTGGTVCGIGQYMRKAKRSVQIVAVDPMGSIVYEHFKTGKVTEPAKTYKIEGIGEDFFPANYDYDTLDDMVKVNDKESLLMARDLLTKEGLYCGMSSGAAVVGAIRWIKEQGDKVKGKNVLVILPDSGNRYMSKVFDDDWMREQGFLDPTGFGNVGDLITNLHIDPKSLITMNQSDKISGAIDLMRSKGISQVPVLDGKGWVKGLVTETALLKALYSGQAKATDSVDKVIDSNIEYVHPGEPVEKVSRLITAGKTPVVVQESQKTELLGIITKIDLITYMGNRK